MIQIIYSLRHVIGVLAVLLVIVALYNWSRNQGRVECENSQKDAILEVIKDDNKIKQETERKTQSMDRQQLLAFGASSNILRPDASY